MARADRLAQLPIVIEKRPTRVPWSIGQLLVMLPTVPVFFANWRWERYEPIAVVARSAGQPSHSPGRPVSAARSGVCFERVGFFGCAGSSSSSPKPVVMSALT